MFDSIIDSAAEKFGLSREKAGGLLAALFGLMTSGGFRGFLDRFRDAGFGDTVDSWITTGDNAPLSSEQVEAALGEDSIDSVADEAGVDRATASSALAAMIPSAVDCLTPDGEVPDETGLLSRIGGFLSSWGGAAAVGGLGAAGAYAGSAGDRIGETATAAADRGKDFLGENLGTVGGLPDHATGAVGNIGGFETDGETDDKSPLSWLLPLILLAVLIALGVWFCGKGTTPASAPPANANAANKTAAANSNTGAATAKTSDASFKLTANGGRYTASGTVPDQATLDRIKAALTAQFGEGNVDFSGLKVDASARPFAAGWWENFSQILPNLKDWKTGAVAFAGSAVTEAVGLPAAVIEQMKTLFGAGWKLPVSIAGAETATKQANEEALKELGEADSVDEVVKALNVSIINFASGKSDIPADAKPILEKAAEVLKKQAAGTTVEIGGYTDNQGNAAANKTLSQSRADAVKKALVGLGVSDAMLRSVGYGDANPVGDNTTEDGRFKNRRIEYKTGSGGAPTATTNSASSNANAAR